MAAKPLPSPEVLRQLLRYEPDSGKLFWLPRPREMFSSDRSWRAWNAKHAGREAMTSCQGSGYRQGPIMGKMCMAHRVAWALHHGSWPSDELDHINGHRTDNRIANLRAATRSQNVWNRGVLPKTRSGVKGVDFSAKHGRWRSRIAVYGTSTFLGLFDTPEEAHAAYCEAAGRLHGEFARTD